MLKKQIVLAIALCLAQGALAMENTDYDAQLYAAARDGDYQEVSNLLNLGANVNARGEYAEPALGAASRFGHIEIVELLLQHRADVNAQDSEGTTPLMDAAAKGHWHTASLLLSAGANVNAQNDNGETPLIRAVSNGNTDIARLLLDAGADINVAGAYGTTPLMEAADKGEEDLVMLLLTYIPATDRKDIKNTFHTLYAMKKMPNAKPSKDMRNRVKEEIIAQLVQRQMDSVAQRMRTSDSDELTAQGYALRLNHQAIADLLDLNNPASREKIRKQIKNNINRLLFDEAQERAEWTRELEDPFGSWQRETENEENK